MPDWPLRYMVWAMTLVDRRTVLRLAAAADLDPRSARKALEQGPETLRGDAGVRAALAMRAMQIAAPPAPAAENGGK